MTQFSKPVIADLIVGLLTADRVIVVDPDDAANRVFIDPDLWGTDRPMILFDASGPLSDSGAQIASADQLSFGTMRPYLSLASPESALVNGTMQFVISDNAIYVYGSKVLVNYLMQIGRSGLGRVDVSLVGGGNLSLDSGDLTVTAGDLTVTAGDITAPAMRPVETVSATNQNVPSNTAYTAFGTEVGRSFVAPPSGAVRVDFHGVQVLEVSAAVGRALFVAIEIRTGSTIGGGTQVRAATDNDALTASAGILANVRSGAGGGSFIYVTGLTAGNPYHARLMGRLSATTSITLANSSNHKILVTPSM